MLLMKNICLLMAFLTLGIGDSFGEIREDFHSSDPDKQHLLAVINDASYSASSISMAYQGLCEAMMAEHLFLPTSKISSFKKGKSKVETAIEKHPENCELRYVRLLIQLNTPNIVNYHDAISEDLEYFMENLHSQIADDQWKLTFIDNLLLGKNLSADQKNQLLTLKENCNATSTRGTSR